MPFELLYSIIPAMKIKKQKEPTQKQKRLHIELLRQMLTLATSGFGLVAALAWNNLIQEFVNNYIKKWLPNGSGLTSLFLYAIIITVLAVTITFQLSKLLQKLQEEK